MMNNPLSLFIKRIKLNIAFQYKVLRTIIDLVVVLYLFVPVFIAIGFYEYHLWTNKPSFLYEIHPIVIAIIMFILVAMSSFRSFYEYGDQLFLIQRKQWYYKFKGYGVLYSTIAHLISFSLIVALISPILWLGLKWGIVTMLLFTIFTSLVATSLSLLKRRLSLIQTIWLRLLIYFFVYLISVIGYVAIVLSQSTILISIVSIFLCIVLIYYALKRQRSYATRFVELSTYDIKGRYANLKWILSMGDYKLPPIKTGKPKPKVFKQSNPLFRKRTAVNILVENGMKQFIRNVDHMLKYVYFAIVSCYALFLMPMEGKIIYTLAFSFIFFFVSKKIWQVFMHGDFIKLYKWDQLTLIQALQKASRLLAVPMFTLLFIVLLFTSTSLSTLLTYSLVGLVGYSIIYGLSAMSVK